MIGPNHFQPPPRYDLLGLDANSSTIPMMDMSIVNTTERPALSIRSRVKMTEISQFIGQAIGEMMKESKDHGWRIAGPPFAYYHSWAADEIDVDCGFPVTQSIAGSGKVRPFTLPAVRAARTMHVGPYVELVKTYGLIEKWIRANGHEPADHCWENYINDPDEVPPEKLMTEILWPIK